MSKHISFKLDSKLALIAVLSLSLLMTIFMWQPFTNNSSVSRTITVNGEATVSSTPDEFDFSPTYQATGSDRQKTITSLNTTANNVITEIKKLGVSEDNITLSENTYSMYWNNSDSNNTISVSIGIKVSDKELAQKIQDYLITTTPYGQITPYTTFSAAKYKTLEAEARTQAITDAKTKAQKSASEIDVTLGKVVTVSDSSYGRIIPMMTTDIKSTSSSSLPISAGKQDVTVTVQVVYEIK